MSNLVEQINKKRINQAAYGITSLSRVITVINRHKSESIPLDNAEIAEIFNGNVMGGLQAAIEELSIEISELSEPSLSEFE